MKRWLVRIGITLTALLLVAWTMWDLLSALHPAGVAGYAITGDEWIGLALGFFFRLLIAVSVWGGFFGAGFKRRD